MIGKERSSKGELHLAHRCWIIFAVSDTKFVDSIYLVRTKTDHDWKTRNIPGQHKRAYLRKGLLDQAWQTMATNNLIQQNAIHFEHVQIIHLESDEADYFPKSQSSFAHLLDAPELVALPGRLLPLLLPLPPPVAAGRTLVRKLNRLDEQPLVAGALCGLVINVRRATG